MRQDHGSSVGIVDHESKDAHDSNSPAFSQTPSTMGSDVDAPLV
jgi:hypothetical protein